MSDVLPFGADLRAEPIVDNLDFKQVLHIFLRTWPFIRPSVKHLAVFVGVSGIGFLIGAGMTLLLIGLATTGIMSAKPLGPAFIAIYGLDPAVYLNVESLSAAARLGLAWPTVITAIISAAVFSILGASLYYYSVWIFQAINQRMRVQLIDRLQAQSLAYHASAKTGDAIYRLYQDSAMVTAIIRSIFLEPLMFIGRYLTGLIIVAAFSPILSLMLLIAVVPIVWLARRFSSPLRIRFRKAREANASLTSWIQESVQGIRVIKATANEVHRVSDFDARSEGALASAFNSRVSLNVLGILAFAVFGITMLGIQSYAAALSHVEAPVFARDLLLIFGFAAWNFGTFSAAISRTTDAVGSLSSLISLWGRAQDMAIGLHRVFEIMDLDPDITDRSGAVSMPVLRQEVSFNTVSFSYIEGRPVLQDIDFKAQVGTVTAIVGPTGSGKSTLMSLLLRLADPDVGRITVDGMDIRDVTVASLRHGIAIATQENILFSDTVLENIRYATQEATREVVSAAATVADAHDFIMQLPDGYDSALGQRAIKLSSGQRQRLVLARAIVRDSLLLILDEPTAALDAETEIKILNNLKGWGQDRCIFLITHRLSTVRHADQILYIRDGTVRAFGTHEALMRNPNYREFVQAEIGEANASRR